MSLLEVETTTYIPSKNGDKDKKSFEVIPEGKYKSHIHNLEYKKTDWTMTDQKTNQQYLCDLVTLEYVIAEGEFTDRHVWSNPIWVFKNPQDGVHEPNPNGNYRYANFLEVIDYNLKKDEKTGALELPLELDTDEIVGKPVIITIAHRKYVDKEGVEKTSAQEKYLDAWKDGPTASMNDDDDDGDLPF